MEIKDVLKLIKCVEVKENEDGSVDLVFDTDENFKQIYIKMFNLTEWSDEHFNKLIIEAISNFEKKHTND